MTDATNLPPWWRQIKQTETCWEWGAGKNSKGYGYVIVDGVSTSAHRAVWAHLRGPIPEGLWIDHVCRNRACVNPAHLRLVTPKQNALENNSGKSAINAVKTHCAHGHTFTVENTYTKMRANGRPRRVCRECQRLASLRYVHRVRKPNKARGLDELLAACERETT